MKTPCVKLSIDVFLSTLSLRRATRENLINGISLIFLSTLSLRRATCQWRRSVKLFRHFYPRSPCGERPANWFDLWGWAEYFYPRSPCGERRITKQHCNNLPIFLSTLSLRRATTNAPAWPQNRRHFYPRSPCGERHTKHFPALHNILISIHALLAESDVNDAINGSNPDIISIHALLAESDAL